MTVTSNELEYDFGFDDFNPERFMSDWGKEVEERVQKRLHDRHFDVLFDKLYTRPQVSPSTSAPKQRRATKRSVRYVEDDGTVCILTPTKTFWYNYYILNGPVLSERGLMRFRRRFRLPFDQFQVLLSYLEDSPLFST